MFRMLISVIAGYLAASSCFTSVTAEEPGHSETSLAINSVGLEFYRSAAARSPSGNLVLSPYLLTRSLALLSGSSNEATRVALTKSFHFSPNKPALHAGLNSLAESFVRITRERGMGMRVTTSNQCFLRKAGKFRQSFRDDLTSLGVPAPQSLDFQKSPADCLATIDG